MGEALRAITADGTPICVAVVQSGFVVSRLTGKSSDAGRFTSIALAADGFGLISYYDVTNRDLKVAHCSNPFCTSATLTTLDSAGDVGRFTSITRGGDGMGLISYLDDTNGLKVAHCSNPACTDATISIVEGAVEASTSIATGPDGLGIISYSSGDSLKVAHCSNPACTDATISTIFGTDNPTSPSIAVGADGSLLISYIDRGDVNVTSCPFISDCFANPTTVDTDVSSDSTYIAVGADGLPLISYYDRRSGSLKVAHCNAGAGACPSATLTTLDSTGDASAFPSITSSISIGADGLGLISYYDVATIGGLKVAHCNNAACTSATLTILDGGTLHDSNNVGAFPSVTMGDDGLGLISYYDVTNGSLKVVHCADRACLVR